MQILNTYRIDPKKINYYYPDDTVNIHVKKLFTVLDKIILGKSIKHTHILSGDGLKWLNEPDFEDMIYRINTDKELFDKYQSIFYILIKHKYFYINNYMENKNMIILFISKSIVKYINNDRSKFMYIMDELPMYSIFTDVLDQLWRKYNEHIIYFVTKCAIFPYLFESISDRRKVCAFCGKNSNVTFIKCYKCRVTHYCSNLCLFIDSKNHEKICPNIFSLD